MILIAYLCDASNSVLTVKLYNPDADEMSPADHAALPLMLLMLTMVA